MDEQDSTGSVQQVVTHSSAKASILADTKIIFDRFFLSCSGYMSLTCRDPRYAVQPTDARLMVFDSVSEATRLWIKGQHFSLSALCKGLWTREQLDGCSLVISRCRMRPSDLDCQLSLPVLSWSVPVACLKSRGVKDSWRVLKSQARHSDPRPT